MFGVTALGSCLGRWCEESHLWFIGNLVFFSFFMCSLVVTWVLREGDLLAEILQLVFRAAVALVVATILGMRRDSSPVAVLLTWDLTFSAIILINSF